VGCFQRFPKLEQIEFVFFIPQRNEILRDTFMREDLEELIVELSTVILAAERTRPKWKTGAPDIDELNPTVDCRFCKYEDVCPALGGLVIEVAKKLNPQLPDVDIDSTEDPEVIEQLWVIQKIVTNWAEGFKKRAIKLAQDGLELPTLRLKTMSGRRNITDAKKFMEIASEYGMSSEEVLEQVSIPLAKVAKSIGDKAERGHKKQRSSDFMDECTDQGIIEQSPSRHTLS